MPKPHKQGPEYSREREFKVILEDLLSRFKTFGEGLAGIREELTEIKERLGRVDRRLDRVEIEIAAIKTEIAAMKTDIGGIKATMATKKDLEVFGKRLVALEHSR